VVSSEDRPSDIEITVAGKHTDRKRPRHPGNEELAAFLDNKGSAKENELVIIHLAECMGCRKLVAQIVASRKSIPEPRHWRCGCKCAHRFCL